MDSPWSTAVVKVFGALLMAVNLAFHSVVALFVGGPFGLALYLVGFITFWTACWYTLRRSHEAGAKD